jgi:hypothetical protein
MLRVSVIQDELQILRDTVYEANLMYTKYNTVKIIWNK